MMGEKIGDITQSDREKAGNNKLREDSKNDQKKTNSCYEDASIFSKYCYFFMWIKFIRSFFERQIEINDLDRPCKGDTSKILGDKLEKSWQIELDKNSSKPSFVKALFRVYGWSFALACLYEFLGKSIASPLQAVMLGLLLRAMVQYSNPAYIKQNSPINSSLLDGNVTNGSSNFSLDSIKPAQQSKTIVQIDSQLIQMGLFTIDVHDISTMLAIFALLFVALNYVSLMLAQPYYWRRSHIAMRCRISTRELIYKKALKLNYFSGKTTAGQIINLLTNDVNRFDIGLMHLGYIILAPLQMIIICFMLIYLYIGFRTTTAIISSMIIYSTFQNITKKNFASYRKKTAERTDERVRLTNEVIASIKVIKMYGWEKSFENLVDFVRDKELRFIKITAAFRTINDALSNSATFVFAFVAIITYVLTGHELDPEVIFVSLSLINLLRTTTTYYFAAALSNGAELLVSCRRVQNYLLLDELKDNKEQLKSSKSSPGNIYVRFEQVYADWTLAEQLDSDNHHHKKQQNGIQSYGSIIENLTFSFEEQGIYMIVGRVGSGKSSLMHSILGNLIVTQGQISINGRLSYASQEPWIFSGSIRENIIFGRLFNIERYYEVLRICSLDRDLHLFQDGDQTLVGERGVSLSGGQKARVNLARALYHDADIYLLDDPLSAVDSLVANHLFEQSVMRFLKNKIVVLATHQLQFLRYARKVLVMDNHKPVKFSSMNEVISSNTYGAIIKSDQTIVVNPLITSGKVHIFDYDEKQLDQAISSDKTQLDAPSPKQLIRSQLHLDKNDSKQTCKSVIRQNNEKVHIVSAGSDTYRFFLNQICGSSVLKFVGFLLVSLLCLLNEIATQFWLSFWIDSNQRKFFQGINFQPRTIVDYLSTNDVTIVYSCMTLAIYILGTIRISTWNISCIRGSRLLHKNLLSSILRAPMIFFDFTPVGIILNRIVRDLGIIDDQIPLSGNEVFEAILILIRCIAITIIVNPIVFIPVIILISYFLMLRSISTDTMRRIKQFEAINSSPVYSHLSTTLYGLTTIRVFNAQNEFIDVFNRHQDNHTSAWFLYIASANWINFWMDFGCLLFISSLVASILLIPIHQINASVMGLALMQAMFISPIFQRLVQLAEVESQMTSVQRLREYIELDSEKDILAENDNNNDASSDSKTTLGDIKLCKKSDDKLDDSFKPSQGRIEFKDLTLHYFKEEKAVLRKLNFIIKPGEKIAIVGRTGAGKSSIVGALFRLYPCQGSIFIDNQDTKLIELTALRRCISIIPQEPILFTGTIRDNLDPMKEMDDSCLWAALEAVKMKEKCIKSGNGLEFIVENDGKNFSIGQRQLICLARAIVKRNKILIMDEATANVDPETDAFIQSTIRKQFSNCTVLTIAHRLATVMDCDKIMVLDAGQLVEFDEAHTLLSNGDSLLTRMVTSTGEQAELLRQMAKTAFDVRHR